MADFAPQVVEEKDDLQASSKGLSGGYPQSKWVAERLLIDARNAGTPVCIFRPGEDCCDVPLVTR